MKKDIHPDYKPVIFHDVTCNKSFLLSSTIKTTETMKYEDGNEYPAVSYTHLTLPTNLRV